jgi:predicted MFS family arabinose efflux permease
LLSPLLSKIAEEFGFDDRDRDIYIAGYMSVCYSIISLPLSFFAGVYADYANRRKLLAIIVLTSGLALILFGLCSSFWVLLILRTISGGCLGATIPVMFSLISDLYAPNDRPNVSTALSSALGGGTLAGQLVCGYVSSYLGWRFSFFFFGSLTVLVSVILYTTLEEPIRGCKDTGDSGNSNNSVIHNTTISSFHSSSSSLNSSCFSMSGFQRTFKQVPTSLYLLFLQSIPNGIPWGVISALVHDFLVVECELSIASATNVIAVFGVGAAVGGIAGGAFGSHIYRQRKLFLPLFIGVTFIAAGFMMMYLLSTNIGFHTYVLIAISASFAACNSMHTRAILLNVSSPSHRGTSMTIMNILNSFGRGAAPNIVRGIMEYRHVTRRIAMCNSMLFWIFAGVIETIICLTISSDEDKIKKAALVSIYANDNPRIE